ncbi:MAG: chemotaxis protein CheD [Candidatus Krumholzibacteriota bacterium]|nr:chemotaxis protein CheD [Candidatus Krumholzibacteriota bacterium]
MEYIRREESTRKVMMGRYKTASAPDKMQTIALGSCVGVTLYDKKEKIGALAHVMLPSWKRVSNNKNRERFADSVIKLMVKDLSDSGADTQDLTAKIFGGARMFDHITGSKGAFSVGDSNIIAVKNELARVGVPITVERVGGRKGRTITFDLSDGRVLVRDSNGNEEIT